MSWVIPEKIQAEKRATLEALADPRPGDSFHEWFSWWCIVEKVTDSHVHFLTPGTTDGKGGTFIDKEEVLTREEFRTKWCYTGADLEGTPFVWLHKRGPHPATGGMSV